MMKDRVAPSLAALLLFLGTPSAAQTLEEEATILASELAQLEAAKTAVHLRNHCRAAMWAERYRLATKIDTLYALPPIVMQYFDGLDAQATVPALEEVPSGR